MTQGQAGIPVLVDLDVRKGFWVAPRGLGAIPRPSRFVALASLPLARRCLGDWKRAGWFLFRGAGGARRPSPAFHRQEGGGGRPCLEGLGPPAPGARALSRCVGRGRAVQERDANISISSPQFENIKGSFSLSGSRKLCFDTHAFVCLLEKNGFTTQQAEIIVSALMNIMKSNMDVIYKDMVTKMQQEIALQRIMSHIGVVKKDMIILEKSEFSALRAVNEKLKLELQQLKKQVLIITLKSAFHSLEVTQEEAIFCVLVKQASETDETSKVRTDSKLDFNLEKSRVKELYSLNERKLLKMRTEIVELNAQQDRALTQTDRKIDTEVAGLKTMLESHKLDNIKYLAGSVFTCLTVALGFYRLWI